ncbi:hypothetical protein C3943_19080 [Lysinibacillus sp. B2A1]|nr:hypothetical protein C3943_19080 [Lysinibacillus sp. B2A1]
MTGGSDFFLITDMEFPYFTKFKVRDEFKIEPTEKVLIGGQLLGRGCPKNRLTSTFRTAPT